MKRSLHSFRTGLRPSLFCLAATLTVAQAQNVPPPPSAPAPAAQSNPAAVGIGEDGSFHVIEYGQNRYEKMQGKSPFEFELAAPPEPEAQNPFEGLSLAGFVGSGNAMTVYLVDAKKERTSVYGDGTGRPNPSGIRIISVNRGPTIRLSTVTLEKDGHREDLGFDDEYLNTIQGGAAGATGGAAGKGNPQQRGGVVRPGGPTNGIVLPNGAQNGAPNPAAQRYQAPAAFIPGRGMVGQAQSGAVIPNQGSGATTPQNTAAQAQLINQLLNNQNNPAAQQQNQPAVIIPQATQNGNGRDNRGQGGPPPPSARRRVVHPSR